MYLNKAYSLLEKYDQNIDSIIRHDKSFSVEEFLKFFENNSLYKSGQYY